MRDACRNMLKNTDTKGLVVSTFHSLGMHILRAEAKLLGYKPQFSIFDSSDTWKIYSELSHSADKREIRDTQTQISNWKSAFVSPEQAAQLRETMWKKFMRASMHAIRKRCVHIRRWTSTT